MTQYFDQVTSFNPLIYKGGGFTVGTTAGTVAAGNDARLSDPRTPLGVVIPETYGTDAGAMQSAIAAACNSGGAVLLTPGQTYTLTSTATVDLTNLGGTVNIIAHGATVNYTGSGSMLALSSTTGSGLQPAFKVHGGFWLGASATKGFDITDVNRMEFYGCKFNFPVGSAIYLLNSSYWCERTVLHDIEEYQCKYLLTCDKGASPHASFARIDARNITLQGGDASSNKFNFLDGAAVYGSVFDGLHGNMKGGVMRLAADMSGTKIRNIDVETSTSAWIFEQGTQSGVRPSGPDSVILRASVTYYRNAVTSASFGWPVLAVVAASDELVSPQGSVTAQASTQLTTTVEASTTYSVDVIAYYYASTTADFKINFTGPGGTSGFWCSGGISTAQTGFVNAASLQRTNFGTGQSVGGAGTPTPVGAARITGTFTTGANNGSITLTFCQATTDATDAALCAGSKMILTKLPLTQG